MGKFLRKSKTTGEVSLLEVSQHQSPLTLGVRTRAKTLALQRLGKSTPLSPSDATSYLQLRSRRLQKTEIGSESKRQRRQNPISNFPAGSRLRVESVNCGSGCVKEDSVELKDKEEDEIKSVDLGIEASFGENVLEFEGRERGTRETTPCSLIRDSVTVGTPGSTTKSANLTDANRTAQNLMRWHIPVANDMDAFFSGAEKQQQKQFVEKYNFDPVNDKPLPGRYEWVKVDP